MNHGLHGKIFLVQKILIAMFCILLGLSVSYKNEHVLCFFISI